MLCMLWRYCAQRYGRRGSVIKHNHIHFTGIQHSCAPTENILLLQYLFVSAVAVNAHSSPIDCSLARWSVSSGRKWNLFDQILSLSAAYIDTWFVYIGPWVRRESIWGNGVIGPLILNLGARCRWEVTTPRPLPRYPLNGGLCGPQSRPGQLEGYKSLVHLLVIEPWSFVSIVRL